MSLRPFACVPRRLGLMAGRCRCFDRLWSGRSPARLGGPAAGDTSRAPRSAARGSPRAGLRAGPAAPPPPPRAGPGTPAPPRRRPRCSAGLASRRCGQLVHEGGTLLQGLRAVLASSVHRGRGRGYRYCRAAAQRVGVASGGTVEHLSHCLRSLVYHQKAWGGCLHTLRCGHFIPFRWRSAIAPGIPCLRSPNPA